RVGGDVEHATQRTPAETGHIDGRAVRTDAVLHHRAPLSLGEREEGRDDHHESEKEDEQVAHPRRAAQPPSDEVGQSAHNEDDPDDEPDGDEDRESLHGQIPRTRGGPNSRYPGGRPSAPVASGLSPRVTLRGGAASSQSKVASS